MVIRVNPAVITFSSSHPFIGTVCQHLVHVHIGTGSGATLNSIYNKFIGKTSTNHFITGPYNCFCLICRKSQRIPITLCRCLLYFCKVADKYRMQTLSCNRKILFCPQSLYAIISLLWHFHCSDWIGFHTHFFCHDVSLSLSYFFNPT